MVVKTQLSFICYAVIQISNYNYMFRPYLVAIIRLYILSFKSFVQNKCGMGEDGILPHCTPEICNLTNHRTDPTKCSINLVYVKMNKISSSNVV